MKYIAVILLVITMWVPVEAQEVTPSGAREDILKLRDVVAERKGRLSELNQRIEEYKQRIKKKQTEIVSLGNQVGLIENRIVKTGLDIEAKNVEIETVVTEIKILEEEITDQEVRLERGRDILARLLRELNLADRQTGLQIILSNKTFSEFFAQVKLLEDVQKQLQGVLDNVELVKVEREAKRVEQKTKLSSLEDLKKELEAQKNRLQDEQGTKIYLLAEAEDSEQRFAALLRQLREESQLIDAELGSLEDRLTERLRDLDLTLAPGAVLSWPFKGVRTITAGFHDPEYPFRYLFEHSGLDLRADMGTPIGAAAPGIVAVARRGRLYGNYIVILHGNKLATVYAHLSQIRVEPDQVVQRGETIGLSGGRPGHPGAGLSSGPHLHFEVRANGIPTNPLEYLVSL